MATQIQSDKGYWVTGLSAGPGWKYFCTKLHAPARHSLFGSFHSILTIQSRFSFSFSNADSFREECWSLKNIFHLCKFKEDVMFTVPKLRGKKWKTWNPVHQNSLFFFHRELQWWVVLHFSSKVKSFQTISTWVRSPTQNTIRSTVLTIWIHMTTDPAWWMLMAELCKTEFLAKYLKCVWNFVLQLLCRLISFCSILNGNLWFSVNPKLIAFGFPSQLDVKTILLQFMAKASCQALTKCSRALSWHKHYASSEATWSVAENTTIHFWSATFQPPILEKSHFVISFLFFCTPKLMFPLWFVVNFSPTHNLKLDSLCFLQAENIQREERRS